MSDMASLRRSLRAFARQLTPPILVEALRAVRRRLRVVGMVSSSASPAEQVLDIYWDPEFAAVLEKWGEATVWKEIQLLMVNCPGKVLDIACGTGKVIEILRSLPLVDVHGCDISDVLIEKAIARGIPRDHLTVCDATSLPYDSKSFDAAYSIGSLEHFTEVGITGFLRECRRVVRGISFHQIPVSSSGVDEGWIATVGQSFFINSVGWWLPKFRVEYETVYVLDSTWAGDDHRMVGKWFVCADREQESAHEAISS